MTLIKGRLILFWYCIFLIIPCGCSQPQSTAEIDKDIAIINGNINKDMEDYNNSGGLVKSLIAIRLNINKNTKAMLEQKKTGLNRFININYTVDGKPYILTEDVSPMLKELKNQISQEERSLNTYDNELQRSGGLVQAVNAMKVASQQNTIVMLNQKMLFLKYGIPLYEISSIGNNANDKIEVTKESAPKQTEPDIKKEMRTALEKEYMDNYLELYDFKASMAHDILEGKMPGVVFKLKNKGDKTLDEVAVTVYFKDTENKTIAEEKDYPINTQSTSFDNNHGPLKPGYIWQLEPRKFYQGKSVPSEWKPGNAEAKITSIHFE
ncbi:MAG: hypothetical protein ACLPT6_01535 [Desulfobaccales bacterium]